jgi:hypothetical protein
MLLSDLRDTGSRRLGTVYWGGHTGGQTHARPLIFDLIDKIYKSRGIRFEVDKQTLCVGHAFTRTRWGKSMYLGYVGKL